MVNANLKNDVTVKTDGGLEYTLRPSFSCLMEIERKTDKSLLLIIEEFTNGRGKMSDMVVILKEGTRAFGKPIREEEIEDLMETTGLLNVANQLVGFFFTAMYGGKSSEAAQKKIQDQPTVLNS